MFCRGALKDLRRAENLLKFAGLYAKRRLWDGEQSFGRRICSRSP